MTNNFENEDNDDFLDNEGTEAGGSDGEARKSGVSGNLAEAWRSKPLFKFMVLTVAVFVVGVGAMNLFGGSKTGEDTFSKIGAPPVNLKGTPGGQVSPYVREQTELANQQRSNQAIASGGSALPTPVGRVDDMNSLDGVGGDNDALKELRAETEMLKKQLQQQQVQQVQYQQQSQQRQPERFDNTLSEAMQRQMKNLLDGWSPKGIKNVVVTKEDKASSTASSVPAGAMGSMVSGAAATVPALEEVKKAKVSAGTVSYAQLLTEANSDVPGPIMAQIVSGPLSGARAIGSFQVANGYDKYLVLKFSLADKNGVSYGIDAYALDPETTLGGMATEVDERYFSRVVLPAAAGFLQGLGQVMGQGNTSVRETGTTTITDTASGGFKEGMYNGLGVAAKTMGQFFQQQSNLTKPLVRVAAGTPIGMFFVSPVYEDGVGGYAYNRAMAAQGIATGYPGTTVSGYGAVGQANGVVPYPNYANSSGGMSPMNVLGNQGMGGLPFPMSIQGYGQ